MAETTYKVLSSNPHTNIREYLVDTEADLENLPFNIPGSLALVADGGAVFVCNNQKEWVELT